MGRVVWISAGLVAIIVAVFAAYTITTTDEQTLDEDSQSLKACAERLAAGLRPIADDRSKRFLGKVEEYTALCRGGDKAAKFRDTPWVDWTNYWGTGDNLSRAEGIFKSTGLGSPNERGILGAGLDLEYQRIELIKFNLFDNYTYEQYVKGMDGLEGPSFKVWKEMRLPAVHPDYKAIGGDDEQICGGDLIRHRTLTGICNDVRNPLMGSTGMVFARNVQLNETFPRLSKTELIRNRHANRLELLKPDPQVISRVLFSRKQSNPNQCNDGYGLPGNSKNANCDYKKAPFFNVLAAFWIQFMNHDWFSHLNEGRNQAEYMAVGCTTRLRDNVATSLTSEDVEQLGCRPGDRMEKALVADENSPATFQHEGKEYLKRAPKTFQNTVTAWWDASQIYGYDETSKKRVKRDPTDPAKLLLSRLGNRQGPGETQGYLPLFEDGDDINPAWKNQEATAFPDNWTIGMSLYHNLFSREHNIFVDGFRMQASKMPNADSGLRNPDKPKQIIRYNDVTAEELFQVARLVVAAEIAKIHTIEWTTQLLYNDPLNRGMNSNWSGLFREFPDLNKILGDIVVSNFGASTDVAERTAWYSVFASGPGIFGLGSRRDATGSVLSGFYHEELDADERDVWDLTNPDHLNGGVNHFGAPFNFPEEFITVYRLHPLLPDLIEYRELDKDSNVIQSKIPVVETFRGAATESMYEKGLANWALSMGRQQLGKLALQNHPQFLQNLKMPRLKNGSGMIDVAALDIIRDRERGIPRYNEFRRQYGLRQLTSFDDFVDQRLPTDSPGKLEQEKLAQLLRDVYGQHKCDNSRIITMSQVDADGSPITDCLSHPDGTLIDNIEDVDTMVGWLAESARPHGFAISETQFVVFILNASRRLFSDRFFTSSFRPEFYSDFGRTWVNNNGPGGKVWEKGEPNGHKQEVSPLKRVLLRAVPELADELVLVVNVFDPWARDRGEYYSLKWMPRPGAESDESF